MNRTPDIYTIIAAIGTLRRCIANALMGGLDPSDVPDVQDIIRLLQQGTPAAEPEKLDNVLVALTSLDYRSGTARTVVLARAQRYLQSLTLWLDDQYGSGAPSTRPRKVTDDSMPTTLFDERMLAIRGIGKVTASRLASRGIESPLDLLFCLPRNYDDRRTLNPIRNLIPGTRAVTRGEIRKIRSYGRPWKRITEMVLADGDDCISAIWFSRSHPDLSAFAIGESVMIAGMVSRYRDRLQIAHPVLAREPDGDRIGRIVPVYPEIPGVPGRTVEKAIRSALEQMDGLISDPVPTDILSTRGLLHLADALRRVHLPPHDADTAELDTFLDGRSPAHLRLAYDELLFLQMALLLRRIQQTALPAPPIPEEPSPCATAARLMDLIPTVAQERVVREIRQDMALNRPMRRLLQGDVGSGKTLVAFCALLACARAGYQAALMAPTEILAEQHMRGLAPLLEREGIRCALLLGNARTSVRKKVRRDLETGVVSVAIGTHALIQESVAFHHLGLAVVDEQHRFGVSQRLGLTGKARDGMSPHLLVMTATPIPRSLALTVHGDLDISVLDELPAGRAPVTTRSLLPEQRDEALIAIDAAVSRNEQVYVVCPLIEASETLSAQAAETVFTTFRDRYGERAGLLHGRMMVADRDRIMTSFYEGEIAVLVCTSIVEVGVHVPRATVLLIESAERFGLAQLHQLRGRIGRSTLPSTCFLLCRPESDTGLSRMEILARSKDGFDIAEQDLLLRGPGELYGRRQAGLPGFRFANLKRDGALLTAARQDAMDLLDRWPGLAAPDALPLREELQRRIQHDDGPVGEESG